MATSQSSSKPRSRSSSSSKSSGSRSSSAKRAGSSSGSSRSAAARNSSRSANSRNGGSRSARSSSNGSRTTSSGASNGVVGKVTGTVGKAKAPLAAGGAAAAGMLGGIVLGARVLRPRKKILGIPISRRGLDFKPVAKEVQKAGKQLGRLTDEMAQARKQAKKVGDALS